MVRLFTSKTYRDRILLCAMKSQTAHSSRATCSALASTSKQSRALAGPATVDGAVDMVTKRTPIKRNNIVRITPQVLATYAIVKETYGDEHREDEHREATLRLGELLGRKL